MVCAFTVGLWLHGLRTWGLVIRTQLHTDSKWFIASVDVVAATSADFDDDVVVVVSIFAFLFSSFYLFQFFFCWLYKIRLCASVFQRFTLHTILPFFNFLSPNAMRRLVCSSLLSHNIDNILVIRNMANSLSKKKMSRTRSKNQSDFLLSFPVFNERFFAIFPNGSFVCSQNLFRFILFVRSHVRMFAKWFF